MHKKKTKRIMRKMFLFFLIPIVLVAIAMLYVAFVYEPRVDFSYNSEFLKEHQTQYLKIDDYNIHYLKSGEGEPIILIHGGGAWLYSFRHNIPFLSKYFSVYALDMPGHGYTEYSGELKFDLDTFADVLDKFMNRLNISKATLVGNSWGGGWALYFTQKYPERVSNLILIGSSGYIVREKLVWELLKYPILGEIVTKFVTLSLAREEYKDTFYDRAKVTDAMLYEVYKPVTFKKNRHVLLTATRNIDFKITENNMSKVSVPTFIIWGKYDKLLSYKLAYRFHQDIKNSKLLIMDNCGHLPHEELPEITNKLILDFIEKRR
ncbi:MAG: alpha/beta fold hydrolase [Candidatus Micrarchaeota archaeon]